MNETIAKKQAVSDPKRKNAGFWSFLRRSDKTRFFRDWRSPFYFFLFVILIGFAWCIYGLVDNQFSSAFNWDYSHQYLPFAQHYHDVWRHFFTTGEFLLYDNVTFIGEDNIGANSYYGLFDPFTILLVIFPRAWVPQLYAIFTIIKITLCAGFARMYLKYRGISEGASRFGAVAIAFSGYLNFMVGFPTFVSAITYAPLILYGIEKVIRERKIVALAIGIFLMMLSCFLLVVTMCIWGVIYAVFRYFATIKERNLKENLLVILAGVLGFGIGLALGAWILIPSFRLSSSTGRTSSIGSAYMHALIDSVKAKDFAEFFRLFFLEVGENPGREMMGLISFFYPSGGFQVLPLLRSSTNNYDAWTASYFCFTPFVVLFFSGIIYSIREKKISHIIAILGCLTLVFTTFAYYFFFGFSGNGYGRWYFVLVPAIVYYGCWAYDHRKNSPRWIPLVGAIIALVGTFLSYCAIYWALENLRFDGQTYVTYYPNAFLMPSDDFQSLLRHWYLIYEVGLIVIETILFFVGYRKKWLSHAILIMVALEAIAMGNTGYFYVGLWSLEYSYMGGSENLANSRYIAEKIDQQNDIFARVNFDQAKGTTNFQYAVGEPASSSFHSLISYADTEFFYINQSMSTPSTSSKPTYGDGTDHVVGYSWSGSYHSKRLGTDYALGYRYYVVENYPTNAGFWVGESVPFGATEIEEASYDRNAVRVYRVDEEHLPVLGHGVDKNYLYRMGKVDDTKSNFYGNSFRNGSSVHANNIRNGFILAKGAILDDDVELPKSFSFNEAPAVSPLPSSIYGIKIMNFTGSGENGFKATKYTANNGDYLFPSSRNAAKYGDSSLGYFFDHFAKKENVTGYSDYASGVDRLVLTPRNGGFFSDDENGAYFQISYSPNAKTRDLNGKNFLNQPRVIFFDENNQVVGYDATTFGVIGSIGEQNNWYSGYTASGGFYAKGKVKSICIIWRNAKTLVENISPSNFIISPVPYSYLKSIRDENNALKFENVKKINNGYTFDTNYAEETIAVTQLGYDDGWKAVATDINGVRTNLKMLRLDGGLQGFLVPAGSNKIEFTYYTPGLTIGLFLAGSGLIALIAYVVICFALSKRKESGGSSAASIEYEKFMLAYDGASTDNSSVYSSRTFTSATTTHDDRTRSQSAARPKPTKTKPNGAPVFKEESKNKGVVASRDDDMLTAEDVRKIVKESMNAATVEKIREAKQKQKP